LTELRRWLIIRDREPQINFLDADHVPSQRGESGFDADTIDEASENLRTAEPGRYGVDEIRGDPFPSGRTSRAWGQLVRQFDGSVAEEPHPWPE
jgi:hypothetical protein